MLKALKRLLGFGAVAPPPVPDVSARDRVIVALQERFAKLRATYDAARTSDEFKNYWSNADRFDADSANSKDVRHTLVSRSRYEIANNGYSDGIAQTKATHVVGVGPTLRMQSGSEGFNRMVEFSWHLWSKAIHFRRKLWCMANAKHGDGEGIGVMRKNPRVRHPIPLDVCLYETEQCQTPYLPFTEPGYIDGIKFDEFGNPVWYDILHQHPGTSRGLTFDMVPERVPADRVLHWFKMRRPGQHRGVPEMSSTLNTGAASRRWREATLSAAERAALLTLMMETQQSPDEEDFTAPYSTMDIEKGLMTFLPVGWKPNQLEGKFPTATHAEFHKTLINEQARAVSMPFNVAACDSSSYNYASGRLDHQTYYGSLDIDREDCNDLVLDPLFETWFDLAVARFGWLGGNPEAVTSAARAHIWDWPKHRVADVEAEANANKTKLTSGQTFLHRLYTDAGQDLADEITSAAQSLGVDEAEIQKRLLDITLPPPKQQPPVESPTPAAVDEAVAAMLRNLQRRQELPKVNGNGAAHVH